MAKKTKNTLHSLIGKTLSYYDDGKIRKNRKFDCVITEVIPFKDIDDATFASWKIEVYECQWLYAKKTDFFIKGLLKVGLRRDLPVVFARTLDKRWFSLGCYSGLLDISNEFNV